LGGKNCIYQPNWRICLALTAIPWLYKHDRPELIFIVSGRRKSICEGEIVDIQADMVLWVRAEERHQIINSGAETLKLATVFVPAYTAKANYERCLEGAKLK
jgi:mannose-6-phosphate isomerase-like protein (cupin superfamily)